MMSDSSQLIKELEATITSYAKKNSDLQEKIADQQSEISRLRAELEQLGIKKQVRRLYTSLDKAIEQRIHNRALRAMHSTSDIDRTTPSVQIDNRAELHAALRVYDAETYFTYKTTSSRIPLKYRLMSKVYRTGRDASAAMVKSSVRLARKVRK